MLLLNCFGLLSVLSRTEVREVMNFTSVDLVSVAAGYPKLPEANDGNARYRKSF